jgi:hypothetical protein
MPLTLDKRNKGGNAFIPSFFGKQPFALSNHHKLARITLRWRRTISGKVPRHVNPSLSKRRLRSRRILFFICRSTVTQ